MKNQKAKDQELSYDDFTKTLVSEVDCLTDIHLRKAFKLIDIVSYLINIILLRMEIIKFQQQNYLLYLVMLKNLSN